MFKQLRLEIGLKDALIEMPKFNKWLSSLLRNKEKLEEIAITTVNVECSAIIMNKVPEKLEDPGKFLIPCALQANSNRPMDVVSKSRWFSPFLADFVVVNFEPDPRVPIILGRPFLRTANALIDLYEETLTLRTNRLVATSITNNLPPSSSPVKTSDNLEKFADELAPLDSLPPGNDDSTLKKDFHEVNFQVYSNPLFEFDDNFKSSNVNPLLKSDIRLSRLVFFSFTTYFIGRKCIEAYLEIEFVLHQNYPYPPSTLEISS
ncbi:reverse transcriptase domain-containing protein [Tanacetum coccineum]